MRSLKNLSLICMLLVASGCSRPCPTDAEIQALFDRHADSLNKLVAMANEEEKLSRIERDGSYDETAVSVDRAEEYLQLLEEMELEGAFVNWAHDGKGLLLHITPEGWTEGSLFKNLRYHKVPAVHADVLGKPTKYPIYKTLGDKWQLQIFKLDGED